MTTNDAIKVLDEATQPQSAGKIVRQGFVQIQIALETLANAAAELARRDAEDEKASADAKGDGKVIDFPAKA